MINVSNEFSRAKIRKIKQFKINKKSHLKNGSRGENLYTYKLNKTKVGKIQKMWHRENDQISD